MLTKATLTVIAGILVLIIGSWYVLIYPVLYNNHAVHPLELVPVALIVGLICLAGFKIGGRYATGVVVGMAVAITFNWPYQGGVDGLLLLAWPVSFGVASHWLPLRGVQRI